MKILIVDNEKSALYSFLDQIVDNKTIDFKLFMNNPLDAITYTTNDVKGAFIDLKMPIISGEELARKLILKNPSIKIVFVTGYTIDEEALYTSFKENLLGILYKPFDSKQFQYFVNEMKEHNDSQMIKVHMFGTFDVFVNDTLVEFNSAKAKEMLALLIVYRGRTLTKNKIMEHLWPEKEYNKADVLYRYARWKLIETLRTYSILHMVNFSKAKINLNYSTNIHCDYWDFLDEKQSLEENENKYRDDTFLREYDWALEYYN